MPSAHAMRQHAAAARRTQPALISPGPYAPQVESLAPDWLKRYLAAKRMVEAELGSCDRVKPVILRPSFIWTW